MEVHGDPGNTPTKMIKASILMDARDQMLRYITINSPTHYGDMGQVHSLIHDKKAEGARTRDAVPLSLFEKNLLSRLCNTSSASGFPKIIAMVYNEAREYIEVYTKLMNTNDTNADVDMKKVI
ncbi:hypothetical protein PHYBLDRAFT_147606 [Phycomyces blakesleeanus NRRL 1555(-)]|uniref:Uncharacterized protein n=1 Tax=Phycomyces blakesleeanus (strain ATCC 8743b / DSM 1359 / FGSC 10004 / NBRC 33097 / NRRL 1555) TaxID=763407 RepID=A0A167LTY8_PHYB8|nr:hypothetical protein PHYBLDRAFT_147606 [Phycomyces blakesleeanus NRRL 1555(-)]OAD71096.1 hypothetical protein PHYBLDRAFT_147606 [Phycomyces blakesleeanus NRRL 1555(-)]|eukprot:XP_018289136.1 hypothetical protein PHYBLDRAFT_147606 [Phycomyces blakesleeanus NRRL 1555(-)]